MTQKYFNPKKSALALFLSLACSQFASAQSLMLVGNDEKFAWDEQGKTQLLPDEGKDSVDIFDISTNPAMPKLIKRLSVKNSLAGPPVNMVITNDNQMAIVANSLAWEQADGKWKAKPDNKINLIDLAGEPKVIETVSVGQQPSGMDLNPAGDLLLIANRADKSISVLKIKGKKQP